MVNKKTLRNLLMASALVSLQACGGGGGGGGAIIDAGVKVAKGVGWVSIDNSIQNPINDILSLSANWDMEKDGVKESDINEFLKSIDSFNNLNASLDTVLKNNPEAIKTVEQANAVKTFKNYVKFLNNDLKPILNTAKTNLQKGVFIVKNIDDTFYNNPETFMNNKLKVYNTETENDLTIEFKEITVDGEKKLITVEKETGKTYYAGTLKTETNDEGKFVVEVKSSKESLTDTVKSIIEDPQEPTYTEWVQSNLSGNTITETRTKTKITKRQQKIVKTYTTYKTETYHDGTTHTTSITRTDISYVVLGDEVSMEQESRNRDLVPTVVSTQEITNELASGYPKYGDPTDSVSYSAWSEWTTTSTSDVDSDSTVDNGDGTFTTTTTRITTQHQQRTRTKTVQQTRSKTIKTASYTLKTFSDGSTTKTNMVYSSETTTTENYGSPTTTTETQTQDIDNAPGIVVNTTTTSVLYTDNDPNLGTRTPGYSTTKSTYETNEYLDRDADGNLQGWANGGKKQVKASDAYSRGWTGKGVTIAVADTGYDLDHSEFTGQVVATKDYTGTGMDDTHGHGTHVLGSVVAKKDGAGTHGVAFDSKAVVIKITNSNYANTSLAADGFSWAADNGASVGNISANSNYDVYFRNNLVQMADGTYKSTDDRYDYGAGNFYNMQTPDEWIAATAKDLIVVNSAGNQGLAVPANPGYFATATDDNGDLVLGGKMLIVGAVDQNNNIASWSNKAGHICQVVVDNSCTDIHKVSDFYILAPGWTYSTKNDGTYGTMAGTSMAAPYVTGGVALIRQMWPYMKGENVVRLLTTTANKSIRDYNVNIHGAGVMDLEKATRPVGATGIPTTGRTTSSVSTVSLSSSGGSGSSLSALQNSTALSSVMIVDEFARDFYVDLTKGITVQDKRKYSDVQVAQYGAAYLPFQQQYGNYEQGGQFPIFMEGLEFGLYTDKDGNGDWSTNISKKFKLSDKFSIKTTAGTMNEQDTWLGNYTDGALSVGKNNVTNFGQLGVEYMLDKNTFTFDMAQGYTDVNTKSNSLISSVDTLETQSMKLGFERKIDSATRWGITYSIPNRITKGGTNLNVPYATTLDGEVIYDNVKTDLSATTPEKDIGVYFSHNGEGETDWKTSFSIEYRQNVAGVAGDNKIAPSLQVSKKFYGACVKLFGMMNKKPGCEKIRIEKEINKLAKKKGTEEKIAALKYQLLGVEKQIAHINGDKQTVAKLDKEIALGWKQ